MEIVHRDFCKFALGAEAENLGGGGGGQGGLEPPHF